MSRLPLLGKVATLITIPLLFQFLFVWHVYRMQETERATHETTRLFNQMLLSSGAMLSVANNAERGVASFLLTGEESFLEAYHEGSDQMPALAAELSALVDRAPFLREPTDALLAALTTKMEVLGEQVDLARRVGGADRLQIGKSLNHLEASRRAGQAVVAFFKPLMEQQRERLGAYHDHLEALQLEVIAGALVSVLLVLFIGVAFRRVVTRRLNYLVRNTQRIAAGEALPEPLTGNDELALLDGAFHALSRDLYQARRRQSVIFENVPDVIFTMDKDGLLLTVSNACRKVLGFDPTGLVGRPLTSCVAPNSHLRAREFVALTAAGERVSGFELDLAHQRGHSVPVALTGEWSAAEECVFCIAHDLTQEKDAARERAHLAGYPEENPSPVFEVDLKGRLLYLNPSGRRQYPDLADLGTEHPLIAGLDTLVRSLTKQGQSSTVREVVLGDMEVTEQCLVYQPDTRTVRCYCHDISVLKRNELNLVLAKEEAERANRAKSEFLSRMSHELRTPLNSIIGFAQVMQTQAARQRDSVPSKNLDHIVNSGHHLLTLVNDVLDLSRIEAGDMTIHLRHLPVRKTVGEVLHSVRQMAGTAGVTLRMTPERGQEFYVVADPTRLRQVLLNLLTNAIKYNRAGGRVTVTAKLREDKSRVQIAVADTGPGIPADQLSSIFRPFTRLAVRKNTVDGTGIGLSIAKSLVELMDGQIGISSVPERGSTFYVTLPVGSAPARSPEVVVEPRFTPPPARRATVLYVEDNPVNLELVEEILADRPHIRLSKATYAKEGLEIARSQLPDLIILDIHLPDMDGFAALQALKNDHRTAGIPVLALTAQAMPHDVERGLELGFTHYITKPLSVSSLLHIIDTTLANSA